MRRRVLPLLLLLLAVPVLAPRCATVAHAQTPVVNPTTVEYSPSADHATSLPDGTPMVASYDVRHFIVGGSSTPACVTNIGKPTPTGAVVSMPLSLTCLPLSPTTRYAVRVVALGPTGEGVSDASNPFVVVGPPARPGGPVVSRP